MFLYAVFAASCTEAGQDTLSMHPGAHCALVQPMADDGGTLCISRGVQTRYTAARLLNARQASAVVEARRNVLPAKAVGLGRLQRAELNRLVQDGYWEAPETGSRQLTRLRVECFDSLCVRGLAWRDPAGTYRATEAGHAVVKLRQLTA